MDEPPSYTVLLSVFSGQELTHLISFVLIAVLLLLSAGVAASEVSFFSLTSRDLDDCRQRNDRKDKIIIELLGNTRLLRSTITVVGITINIAVITFSSFQLWRLAGTQNPVLLPTAIATLVATFVLVSFGEFIPKAFATKNPMKIARLMSGPWKLLVLLWKPISTPLTNLGNFVERRFKKGEYQTTVEELNQAFDLATIDTNTTDDEKEILRGIVNFGTLTVKQAMRSRTEISAIDVALHFHELMEYVNKSGFSRIPVYRDTLDKIEGVLYIKDLLPFLDQEPSFQWQKLLRPGFFVPESKKIDSLLHDFQEKRVHMALVIDEYGGTSGLITMEDIIEEIIGDINDEFDEVGLSYQKIDEHTFVFEGKTSLRDFCRALNIEANVFDLVKGESESVGGLILEINHELPKVDDQIRFERFTFTIESVDRKKIKRIKVHLHEQKKS